MDPAGVSILLVGLIALVTVGRVTDGPLPGRWVSSILIVVLSDAAALTDIKLWTSWFGGPGVALGLSLVTVGGLVIVNSRHRIPGLVAMVIGDILQILAQIRIGKAEIDVFNILQQGSWALLHGANPYPIHYVSTTPGLAHLPYPYGPGALLATFAGRLVGDVRFEEMLCMGLLILAVTMIARRNLGSDGAWLLLALMLCSEFATFMIVQAWIELAGVTAVALWLWLRTYHRRAATVVLGLGGSTTFMIWGPLLVIFFRNGRARAELIAAGAIAVLVSLPLALWTGLGAFVWDVLLIQLKIPARGDALNVDGLWLQNHGTALPGVVAWGVPLLLAAAFLLSRRKPDLPTGLIQGTTVLFVFLLLAKFAFFNYYFIVVFMTFAALAMGWGISSGKHLPGPRPQPAEPVGDGLEPA
ncbi:MAG: hypothetical protein ACREOL_10285 [Candidatus Dormibacteria bacterium]